MRFQWGDPIGGAMLPARPGPYIYLTHASTVTLVSDSAGADACH